MSNKTEVLSPAELQSFQQAELISRCNLALQCFNGFILEVNVSGTLSTVIDYAIEQLRKKGWHASVQPCWAHDGSTWYQRSTVIEIGLENSTHQDRGWPPIII